PIFQDLSISRLSQALAKVQSASAVDRDTPSSSAACGRVKPAKKRSLTSCARRGEAASRRSSASCSASRSSPSCGAARAGWSSGSGCCRRAPPGRGGRLRRGRGPRARRPGPAGGAEEGGEGVGGRGEEVPPAVPVLLVPTADEPEIGLVDQGGGLQRLPGRLLGQPLRGQFPQFVVDERQQLLGSVRVAVLDGGQN